MSDVAVISERAYGRIPNDDDLRRLLDQGIVRWRIECTDIAMQRPLNLDEWPINVLAMQGMGLLQTNFQKSYEGGDLPMLCAPTKQMQLLWNGVNFLGRGTPDHDLPLTYFPYEDRGSLMLCGWYNHHGHGAKWAVDAPGAFFAETPIYRCEFNHNGLHGCILGAARNVTISGRTAFERNGQRDPGTYNGLHYEASTANDAASACTVEDCNFEHDDSSHIGFYGRHLKAIKFGGHRFVQCGYDFEADSYSTTYPSTMYGSGKRRVVGPKAPSTLRF